MSNPSTATPSHVSQDERSSSGNSAGWYPQSCQTTCAVVRQNASGSVHGNVQDHKYKTGLTVAGLVDSAAKGDARMRQVDQTGDIPSRAVAGCRNVDTCSQFWILIDRDARPWARCRRGDVERAAARGRVGIWGGITPRKHHREPGALGSG